MKRLFNTIDRFGHSHPRLFLACFLPCAFGLMLGWGTLARIIGDYWSGGTGGLGRVRPSGSTTYVCAGEDG